MNPSRTYIGLALSLALGLLGLHLAVHPAGFELQRDEYLYLADGRHLAWGYMEMPPLTALLAYTVHLAGNPLWMVRFWPALFGSLTLLAAAALLRKLGGGLFALLLLAAAYIVSAYLRLNLLFQPNSLDVLLWTLVAYEGVSYIQHPDPRRWLRLGLWFGLGMLNKYTMGFLVLGVLAAWTLERRREVLGSSWFWAGAILAFGIWLPNLMWEWQQGFPFFHHMQLLEDGQLQRQGPWAFFTGQVLFLAGSLLLWLPGLLSLFFSSWAKPFRMWGWVCLVVLLLLDLLHGKAYYSFGLYPALMAFGARYWEKTCQSWKHPAWRWALFSPVVLLTVPLLPLLLPVWNPVRTAAYCRPFGPTGLLRWEDGRNHPLPQDYADMIGWKELAMKVARSWKHLSPQQRAHTLIFCDNYGEAGALDFYGPKLGLPEAYSDNASFLYWLPGSLTSRNLILVSPDTMEQTHSFARDMDSLRVLGRIRNPLARECGTRIYLFYGLHPAFERMLERKLSRDRAAADYLK